MSPDDLFTISDPIALLGWLALVQAPLAPRYADLIAALTTQLDLLNKELVDQQGLLEKGLTEASRVLALQREHASLQGRLGELAATRAQAEGRITETEIEVLRLASDRREEANALLRDSGVQELELA